MTTGTDALRVVMSTIAVGDESYLAFTASARRWWLNAKAGSRPTSVVDGWREGAEVEQVPVDLKPLTNQISGFEAHILTKTCGIKRLT